VRLSQLVPQTGHLPEFVQGLLPLLCIWLPLMEAADSGSSPRRGGWHTKLFVPRFILWPVLRGRYLGEKLLCHAR